jgi:hypothetical protein
MFRASSAHLQEVNDVNCICMQPLVSSFCKSELLLYYTWNVLSFFLKRNNCSSLRKMITYFKYNKTINLIFMEPCIVIWIVVITNKMQLSYGIYYSTYVNSLTCLERYVAHQQEPQLFLKLWFTNCNTIW